MSDEKPLWQEAKDAVKQGAEEVTTSFNNAKETVVQGVVNAQQEADAKADSFLMQLVKSKWTWAILLGAAALFVFFVFN